MLDSIGRRDILVGVVSASATSLLFLIVGSIFGFFEKSITDSQLVEVSRLIIDEERYRDVLIRKMDESGRFVGPIGPRGEQGLQGIEGLPGQTQNLSCITTERVPGRFATCPSGYIVTGCSAGSNFGSSLHEENRCVTDSEEADWTEARCCTLN